MMELTNRQLSDTRLSPGNTTSQMVGAHELSSRSGLLKASGKHAKSVGRTRKQGTGGGKFWGGLEARWRQVLPPNRWKQVPPPNRWRQVLPDTRQGRKRATTAAQTSSYFWDLSSVGGYIQKEKKDVIFNGLR